MTTHQYLGTSINNYKAVKITPGPNEALFAAQEVAIGLGGYTLTNTGWDAAALATAWNASTNQLFTEITATANEDGSLTLTQNNLGTDFEITATIGGNPLQVSALIHLAFSPTPTGGTFTLSDGTVTTAAIAWNATPATLAASIEAAIDALAGYTAGDVNVTWDTDHFVLDFSSGRFIGLEVPMWTFNGSSLTGGDADVTVTTTVQGNAGQDAVIELSFPVAGSITDSEIQKITLDGTVLEGSTFELSLDSGTTWTEPIPYYGDGKDVQIAIQETFDLTDDDVKVYGPAGGPYYVYFGGIYENLDQPAIQIQFNNITGGTTSGTAGAELLNSILYLTSGSGAVVDQTPGGQVNDGGFNTVARFTSLLPTGATVTAATMTFDGAATPVSVAGSFTAEIENAADPTLPTDGADAASRTMASGAVTITAAGGSNEQKTADIKNCLAAYFAGANWTSGNHFNIFLKETGTVQDYWDSIALQFTYTAPAANTNLSGSVTTELAGGSTAAAITGGTFDLAIDANTDYVVTGIAYNVDAATLQSAINTEVGSAVVTVTGGPSPATPLVLTFSGALQKQPITLSAVASFSGVFTGAVDYSTQRNYSTPAEALNVWDLTVCPGQGTLAVDPTAAGTHNFVVITIHEPVDQLDDVTVTTDQIPATTERNIYVRLYNINAMRIQRAINEAYGADVCRVTRVVHSHEWKRIIPPELVSSAAAQPFYVWYYRDVFRVVFVNRFAALNSITEVAINPAPVSSVDPTLSGPDSWMTAGTTIPNVALPYDLADEAQRTYMGFYYMKDALVPLHEFSAARCVQNVSNLLSFRYKLAAQYGIGAVTDYSGITTQITDYKIQFHWVQLTKAEDETDEQAIIASTVELDWDSSPEEIQAAIEAMDPAFSGNVFVTGSLHNSWKPESYTDLDDSDEDYDDLLVQLSGRLAYLPLTEHMYELRISLVSTSMQFLANTSYSREITTLSDIYSVPLPSFKNLRLSYSMVAASLATGVRIGYNGSYTTIASSAAVATIESVINALLGSYTTEALPAKYAKAVKVYGVPFTSGRVEIEFCGYGFQQSALPAGFTIGTTALADIDVTTAGESAANEIETLTITGTPFGGTYTITATPGTTGALAYNAAAATIQTELQLLAGYGSVTVTGTYPNFTVTFPSSLGNVTQLVGNESLNNANAALTFGREGGPDSQLLIEDVIPGRGPAYYEVAENYDTGAVPGTADTLIFDDATTAVKYGIDQTSVISVASLSTSTFRHGRNRKVFATGQKVRLRGAGVAPAGLTFGTDYYIINATDDYKFQLSATSGGAAITITTVGSGTLTLEVEDLTVDIFNRYAGGQIGLPNRRSNGMLEYLATYLTVPGMDVTFGFLADEGNGMGLFRGDTGNRPSTVLINQTASSITGGGVPAVLFLFNEATSTLEMFEGEVGIAFYTGETSLLNSITQHGGELTMAETTVTTFYAAEDAEQHFRHNTIADTISL